MLNSSGIAAVPFLLAVAADTQRTIRVSLALAAASIVALVVPTVLGAVPLWLAVFVHEGSTLLVALNSLAPLRHAARFAGSGAGAGGQALPAAAAAAGAAAELTGGSGDKEGGLPGEGVLRQAAGLVTSPVL